MSVLHSGDIHWYRYMYIVKKSKSYMPQEYGNRNVYLIPFKLMLKKMKILFERYIWSIWIIKC